jgi:hypothetical protein
MRIPSSPGDALDRLTILTLKTQRVADPARRAVAQRHHDALRQAWLDQGLPPPEQVDGHDRLLAVNGELWEVEDVLRAHEARGDFGERFIQLARSVYRLNDRRAALKAEIDARLGAEHPEVKSYGTSQD